MPPITPARITSIGVGRPLPISIGFSTLSISADRDHVEREEQRRHGVAASNQAQISSGMITGPLPICRMASTSTTSVSSPARRHPGDDQADADQQRLDHRDADHAARDVADRRAGEIDEVRAVRARQPGARSVRNPLTSRGAGDVEEARDQHADQDERARCRRGPPPRAASIRRRRAGPSVGGRGTPRGSRAPAPRPWRCSRRRPAARPAPSAASAGRSAGCRHAPRRKRSRAMSIRLETSIVVGPTTIASADQRSATAAASHERPPSRSRSQLKTG